MRGTGGAMGQHHPGTNPAPTLVPLPPRVTPGHRCPLGGRRTPPLGVPSTPPPPQQVISMHLDPSRTPRKEPPTTPTATQLLPSPIGPPLQPHGTPPNLRPGSAAAAGWRPAAGGSPSLPRVPEQGPAWRGAALVTAEPAPSPPRPQQLAPPRGMLLKLSPNVTHGHSWLPMVPRRGGGAVAVAAAGG